MNETTKANPTHHPIKFRVTRTHGGTVSTFIQGVARKFVAESASGPTLHISPKVPKIDRPT